jgi:hypothetical protein
MLKACVTEEKKCLEYRVEETEQEELGIELRALSIEYNLVSDFLCVIKC